MDDVRRELAGLRLRLRLQSIATIGTLLILLFAAGGADVVARALVEADSWRVKTKKADLVNYLDRIIVTTDVDKAQVKVSDANLVMTGTLSSGNIVLAQQGTAPGSPVAGTLWYDSANAKVKFYNGSAWVEAGSPPAPVPIGVFGRLQITGGASGQLDFMPYMGSTVEVNGASVAIPAGGFNLTTSTTLLSNRSAGLGGTMIAGNSYFVYLSNGATPSLRGSTLEPLIYNGAKYLDLSGPGTNWRFLGWVRTNGSNLFEDNESKRFVINYYNRRALSLMANPGYSDGTTDTTYTITTTWAPALSDPASKIEFLSNGEDPVTYRVFGHGSASGLTIYIGAGEDSITVPTVFGWVGSSSLVNGTGSCGKSTLFPSGGANPPYHYLELLAKSNAGTPSLYADLGLASALDPKGTMIVAFVMG